MHSRKLIYRVTCKKRLSKKKYKLIKLPSETLDLSLNFHWTVMPLELPKVRWKCKNCSEITEFSCSEKFRVNAQKKIIDVWLIYKCDYCNATWNCSIYERTSVSNIDPEELVSFHNNDMLTAWSYAFNNAVVKKNNAEIVNKFNYKTDGDSIDFSSIKSNTKISIEIGSNYEMEVRLDRILSEKLNISREQVKNMIKKGIIKISSGNKSLRRSLKGNIEIVILKE